MNLTKQEAEVLAYHAERAGREILAECGSNNHTMEDTVRLLAEAARWFDIAAALSAGDVVVG